MSPLQRRPTPTRRPSQSTTPNLCTHEDAAASRSGRQASGVDPRLGSHSPRCHRKHRPRPLEDPPTMAKESPGRQRPRNPLKPAVRARARLRIANSPRPKRHSSIDAPELVPRSVADSFSPSGALNSAAGPVGRRGRARPAGARRASSRRRRQLPHRPRKHRRPRAPRQTLTSVTQGMLEIRSDGGELRYRVIDKSRQKLSAALSSLPAVRLIWDRLLGHLACSRTRS